MSGDVLRYVVRIVLLVGAVAIGVGCSSDTTVVGFASRGLTQRQLTFALPEGSTPADFTLAASSTLEMSPKSRVQARSGFGRISNSGAGATELGDEAATGAITSKASVTLRQRAHVHGSIVTSGTVSGRDAAVVDGSVTEGIAIQFHTFATTVTFPDVAQPPHVGVRDANHVVTLAPGYYASLSIRSQYFARLGSGVYHFDEFDIAPNGSLAVDTQNGPVFVYVKNRVGLKGAINVAPDASATGLLLGYFGTEQVFVKTPFVGALIAPSAGVVLEKASHEGSFFAKALSLRPDTIVTHRSFSWLIRKISLSPTEVCRNQSVTVSVDAQNPFGAAPPALSIDGTPGAVRVLQLTRLGPNVIMVAASVGGLVESRTVTVNVVECPGVPTPPELVIEGNSSREHEVNLSIKNPELLAGATYHWEFGDGAVSDTAFPATSHRYEAALQRDVEFNSFTVRLTVKRPGQPDTVVQRTITLWNPYAYHKARGVIRPPTETLTPRLAISDQGAAQGRVSVRNPETSALQFSTQRISYQPCDGQTVPAAGQPESISLQVPPGAEAEHAIEFPPGTLTSGVCSVAIDLRGTGSQGQPARVTAYFSVPQPATEPAMPGLAAVLNYVVNEGLAADPTVVTDEELERLVRERRIPLEVLTGEVVPPEPLTALQAGHGGSDTAAQGEEDPIGTPCATSDAPPRPGLSCQFSEWSREPEPHAANALRGDILLSRSCGFIGGLLSQIDPPQKWSHTGIVTNNYVRVMQSTGLEEYTKDHPADGKDKPTDGHEEHAVRYVWPGTLESSVFQAHQAGITMSDPDGKSRNVLGFSAAAKDCGNGMVIYPYVLKPPIDRAVELRPTTHQLADAARQISGHYRFFSYTKANNTDNPSPPGWVNDKPSATVCSSLLWVAAQQLGLTLDADKTDNLNETTDSTPDGLYHYREGERIAAGNYLYKTVYDQVDKEISAAGEVITADVIRYVGAHGYIADPFINGFIDFIAITSDVKDDVANQIVNCFASDFCSQDAKDSDDWKSPGDGEAVSPDDLISWDLYEDLEPLAYRTGRSVAHFTWQPSEGTGTLRGRVLRDEDGDPATAPTPVANATVVTSANPFPAPPTGASGEFSFEGVPAGTHTLEGSLFVGDEQSGELWSTRQVVTVAAEQETVQDLILERPPIDFRRVLVEATRVFVHDEGDEDASTSGATELLLSPDRPEETWNGPEICAGDESRVNFSVTGRYLGNVDTNQNRGAVKVTIHITLHEGSCFLCSACDNNDLDGQQTVVVILCDEATSSSDCRAICDTEGVALCGVFDTVLNRLRVDNDDENTGEFVEVSLSLKNFRQR